MTTQSSDLVTDSGVTNNDLDFTNIQALTAYLVRRTQLLDTLKMSSQVKQAGNDDNNSMVITHTIADIADILTKTIPGSRLNGSVSSLLKAMGFPNSPASRRESRTNVAKDLLALRLRTNSPRHQFANNPNIRLNRGGSWQAYAA